MHKLFTALLVALSISLFAQDQVAKDVLDKLSKTTKSYKNIIIEFDFILENKSQHINNKQTGRLEMQENKFGCRPIEFTLKTCVIGPEGYPHTCRNNTWKPAWPIEVRRCWAFSAL